MAYYIEPAPILEGQDAVRFIKLMETASTRTVDYSAERKCAEDILNRSDLSFL